MLENTNPTLKVKGLPDQWKFPTTRYRGSKRKMLGWLWENLAELDFSTALDVFGGTSTVSILLKYMGKSVTYNDYLSFNRHTGLALVENSFFNLTEEDIEFICGRHLKKTYKTFIADTYHRIYFTKPENEWLDQAIQNVHELSRIYMGPELRYKKAIAYWSIGQAALMKRPFNLFHRKNLHLRTRNVERTFGNKTSWEWKFPDLFRRFANQANSVIFDNGKRNYALGKDAFNLWRSNYDLVYFDPPYVFENQRDNDYAKIYHFLEGITEYSKWENYINWETPHRQFANGFMQWPTTSRYELLERYDKLFLKFRKSTIVISYKSGGLVSIGDIEKSLLAIGKSVKKKMRRYKYALNKRNGKPRENIEWLVIGV